MFTKGVVALTRRFTEEEKTNDILAQLHAFMVTIWVIYTKKHICGPSVGEREKYQHNYACSNVLTSYSFV